MSKTGTGDTFVHVDIARFLDQLDFKVAFFTANALHLGKGH